MNVEEGDVRNQPLPIAVLTPKRVLLLGQSVTLFGSKGVTTRPMRAYHSCRYVVIAKVEWHPEEQSREEKAKGRKE